MKGYVQVYTGNGKGKTTAALGLSLRACGANKKVFIAQFVKSMEYNELKALKSLSSIQVKLYGHGCFINQSPTEEDILAAKEGLNEVKDILMTGLYDLVILDEITIAIYFHLLHTKDVLSLIQNKPDHVELIITGRYCPQEIIDAADLVTEMKEVKHYYTKGVLSREGIDK